MHLEGGSFMYEQEIMEMKDSVTAMFEDLHRHPERGFNEIRTSGIIAEYLKKCGLSITEHVAMTGVVGILDSGRPGKTLMIRADMDCLAIKELADCSYRSEYEGNMHACGHDGHVTMLLGAAAVLAKHKEAFSGKIKFVFQPAEEETPEFMKEEVQAAGYDGAGGAAFMIQEGVMEDVDACLVMHVQPSVPTGKVFVSKKNACASSDVFKITIQGHGGHGARPQEAVDPVPAAGELISAIHMLPTREVSALETCVFSIGKLETPGSVWNAVADKVILEGGYRTFSQKVREHLTKRVEELADSIAKANRCTLKYEHTEGYQPCINDVKFTEKTVEVLSELLGAENVIDTEEPAMTSEDCGAYLAKVPGTLFWLGVGDGKASPALHNPYFHLDPEALLIGIRVHVNNAVKMLEYLNTEGV